MRVAQRQCVDQPKLLLQVPWGHKYAGAYGRCCSSMSPPLGLASVLANPIAFPSENRAKCFKDLDLSFEPLPHQHNLGLKWDLPADCFSFCVSQKEKPKTPKTCEFTHATICRVHTKSVAKQLKSWLAPVAKIIASKLKTRCWKRAAENALPKMRCRKSEAQIASPRTLQTRHPEKFCVYRSHTRLHVDFPWDLVAAKKLRRF